MHHVYSPRAVEGPTLGSAAVGVGCVDTGVGGAERAGHGHAARAVRGAWGATDGAEVPPQRARPLLPMRDRPDALQEDRPIGRAQGCAPDLDPREVITPRGETAPCGGHPRLELRGIPPLETDGRAAAQPLCQQRTRRRPAAARPRRRVPQRPHDLGEGCPLGRHSPRRGAHEGLAGRPAEAQSSGLDRGPVKKKKRWASGARARRTVVFAWLVPATRLPPLPCPDHRGGGARRGPTPPARRCPQRSHRSRWPHAPHGHGPPRATAAAESRRRPTLRRRADGRGRAGRRRCRRRHRRPSSTAQLVARRVRRRMPPAPPAGSDADAAGHTDAHALPPQNACRLRQHRLPLVATAPHNAACASAPAVSAAATGAAGPASAAAVRGSGGGGQAAARSRRRPAGRGHTPAGTSPATEHP